MEVNKGPHNNYFDNLIRSSDIADIVHDLLPGQITKEGQDTLLCDCPHHASVSQKSLVVDKKLKLWNCFGCGQGGNLIHLVEFIQSNHVTKGRNSTKSPSFRKACDYLASEAGMTPLGTLDLTEQEREQRELDYVLDARAYACLTHMARISHEHLVDNGEVLDWVLKNYALSEETIAHLKIGFVPKTDDYTPFMNRLKDYGFTEEEILSTGSCVETASGLVPVFAGRVTFPYWSRGKGVIYMIGRKTPWTGSGMHDASKYKKLPVHSQKYPYIRKCINNSVLYNEDCLSDTLTTIVIAEGITDAIAAIEQGYHVISPVTVRFKEDSLRRLCERLQHYKGKIVIVPDNEVSQAGLKGALETARVFIAHGLDARVAKIPLGPTQEQARKTLWDTYGIDEHTSVSERNKLLQGVTEETENKELQNLLKESKIDVNQFFLDGHDKKEFTDILDEALTPLAISIQNLHPERKEPDCSKALNPILLEISYLEPIQQEYYLKQIQDKLGDTPLGTLKKQLTTVHEKADSSPNQDTHKFNKAVGLIEKSGWSVFRDQYTSGWVTLRLKDHYENIRIGSSIFERSLFQLYYSAFHEPLGSETIKQLGMYLTSEAKEERHLNNRYFWNDDRLFIDMGTKDWRIIEVTDGGWTITQHDKPVFKRFSHMLPLVEPRRNGDVKKVLDYFSVKDPGDQALLLVWLCSCMFEHVPRPGLIITGVQGSAKTSAADLLRRIVDPSRILHTALPADHNEFVQLADHHAIVNLDNLSRLPTWAPDALCRATSGGGLSKRMLYTDDEDITYYFRRVFILNGISIPSTAPDLLDRSLVIALDRIPENQRKRETDLLGDFTTDLPTILGGILDVMVKVIKRRDEKLEEYPRMADWYGFARIAAEELGMKGQFLAAYLNNEKQQHLEVIESHVVSNVLVEFMDDKDSWEGPPTDLFQELTPIVEAKGIKKDWPKRSSDFSKDLKRLSHNLAEIGIEIDFGRRAKRRVKIVKNSSPR